MGRIFVIMGKSAVGKDSVYKILRQEKELHLTTVTPYTTRPKRALEQNGVDYYFVTEEQLECLTKESKVIEHRVYQTVHGPWHYFTVDDGQIDLSRGSYLMIATLEAFERLQEYFGKDNVIPIYLEITEKERIHRAIKREDRQAEPKYKEMCRRYLKDEEDFSEEKLTACGIAKRYSNLNLNQCTARIMEDIKLYEEIK